MAKELTQIRVSLVEKPKTPEYEQFRAAIKREFLDKPPAEGCKRFRAITSQIVV
jgi:hypothetical protein